MASIKQTKASVILKENYHQIPQQTLTSLQAINHYGGTLLIKQQKAQKALQQLHKIRSWHTIKLYIYNIKRDRLLFQIKDISFPKLKVLDLKKNNIRSIQGLCRLDAPNLLKVCLKDNKISDLSQLRKTSSPVINSICFDDNFVIDANKLSELNWGEAENVSIDLSNSEVQCQNISYLTKLRVSESEKSFVLHIKSQKRIKQKNLIEALNRKFQGKYSSAVIQVKQ